MASRFVSDLVASQDSTQISPALELFAPITHVSLGHVTSMIYEALKGIQTFSSLFPWSFRNFFAHLVLKWQQLSYSLTSLLPSCFHIQRESTDFVLVCRLFSSLLWMLQAHYLSKSRVNMDFSAPSPLLQVADYQQAWAIDLKARGQLYMHNEPARAASFFSALGHKCW